MKILQHLKHHAYKAYAVAVTPLWKFIPYQEPEVIEGDATLHQLAQRYADQGAKKTVVITDEVIKSLGLIDDLIASLEQQGIDIAVFSDVPTDPPFSTINKGMEACWAHNFDSMIALGGGSVMDAAKIINVAAAHNLEPRKLAGLFKIRRKGKLFACIPTTAGTGSEVTLISVITDPDEQKKYPIADSCLVPDYAVLAAELTTGLPAPITAATGADALTHAIEALCSRYARPATDQLALQAIRLGFEALPKVVTDGENLSARADMLKASYLAGIAFTQANVGWVHAIAHQFGGLYHTPHGLANGILLADMMDVYLPHIPTVLARMGREIGVATEGDSDEEAAKRFNAALHSLMQEIGIPKTVAGLKKEDLPAIAKRAIDETYQTPFGVPYYFEDQSSLESFLEKYLPAD